MLAQVSFICKHNHTIPIILQILFKLLNTYTPISSRTKVHSSQTRNPHSNLKILIKVAPKSPTLLYSFIKARQLYLPTIRIALYGVGPPFSQTEHFHIPSSVRLFARLLECRIDIWYNCMLGDKRCNMIMYNSLTIHFNCGLFET